MNRLKKVILPTLSQRYIKESLGLGKAFSKILNSMYDLNTGEIYTYIPKELSIRDAQDFEGALYKSDGNQTIEFFLSSGVLGAKKKNHYIADASYWLIEEIRDQFNTNNATACIFEDPIQKAEEISSDVPLPYEFYYNSEVYHFLDKSLSREKMHTIVSNLYNYSPPLIGAIVNALEPIQSKFLKNEEVLTNLAQEVTHIIVGAYDSEGYIIWERDSI